jgi:hypothetical protein
MRFLYNPIPCCGSLPTVARQNSLRHLAVSQGFMMLREARAEARTTLDVSGWVVFGGGLRRVKGMPLVFTWPPSIGKRTIASSPSWWKSETSIPAAARNPRQHKDRIPESPDHAEPEANLPPASQPAAGARVSEKAAGLKFLPPISAVPYNMAPWSRVNPPNEFPPSAPPVLCRTISVLAVSSFNPVPCRQCRRAEGSAIEVARCAPS